MSLTTLQQWLSYISESNISTVAVDLSRFAPFVAALNLHQAKAPVITVVGTNGKGSTVAYLESLYLAAGYRVGVYTSPHLHQFNERVRINGAPVSDAKIIQAFKVLFTICDYVYLSMFDYITLAALYIFRQEDLDLIILEAGIGGRLDAVNIVSANGVVLTSIGLDHTELLGGTRELIAREKVAVFRPNSWAVSAVADPPQVIADYAHELKVDLHQINKDYQVDGKVDNTVAAGLYVDSCGSQTLQLYNTITNDFVATINKIADLMSLILPVKVAHLHAVFLTTKLPGRFDYWAKPCSCLFDVAHNPQATAYLAARIRQHFAGYRCIAVIAMRTTKDIVESCRPLFSLIEQNQTA